MLRYRILILLAWLVLITMSLVTIFYGVIQHNYIVIPIFLVLLLGSSFMLVRQIVWIKERGGIK